MNGQSWLAMVMEPPGWLLSGIPPSNVNAHPATVAATMAWATLKAPCCSPFRRTTNSPKSIVMVTSAVPVAGPNN